MLSSAVGMTSNVPNAFAALGVGSLGMVGISFLVFSTSPQDAAGPLGPLLDGATTPELRVAFFVGMAFSTFFATYALGVICTAFGGILRPFLFRSKDHRRVARVARTESDFLQRMFLEVRGQVSALDGIAISQVVFFAGCGVAMSVRHSDFIFLGLPALSLMGGYSFLGGSWLLLQQFDDALDEYRNP